MEADVSLMTLQHTATHCNTTYAQEMVTAFKEVREYQARPTKEIWICGDPPVRSANDLYRATVADLEAENRKPFKVMRPVGAGPPLPPRCDYELYLLDSSAAKGDVKRTVQIGKLKRALMKKALDIASQTLPQGAPPDYRAWAASAILGKSGTDATPNTRCFATGAAAATGLSSHIE
mmetsp:Transcript_52179/g.76403  ORF Transcript_52179/g.76403 Transcript_52179/m.76403 type:complete len:177 (-) Transcript_52179:129-659(-)